jgi:hypothetical protein
MRPLEHLQPAEPNRARASVWVELDKKAAQRGDAPQKRTAAASGTTQTRPKSGLGLRGRGWHAPSARVRALVASSPLGPPVGDQGDY